MYAEPVSGIDGAGQSPHIAQNFVHPQLTSRTCATHLPQEAVSFSAFSPKQLFRDTLHCFRGYNTASQHQGETRIDERATMDFSKRVPARTSPADGFRPGGSPKFFLMYYLPHSGRSNQTEIYHLYFIMFQQLIKLFSYIHIGKRTPNWVEIGAPRSNSSNLRIVRVLFLHCTLRPTVPTCASSSMLLPRFHDL